jgi:hypothetical protein
MEEGVAMVEYQILFWKDIPAQVRVREGTKQLKRVLPDRFQLAIDNRAMREGIVGADAYLEAWRWAPWQPRAGTLQEVLDAVAAELEAIPTPLE